MGPWGPDMPVTPERPVPEVLGASWGHCPDLCCDDREACRCECSWCDCRYAERMGS